MKNNYGTFGWRAYKRVDGNYWIWEDNCDWIISPNKGDHSTYWIDDGHTTVVGNYNPAVGATGVCQIIIA